MSSKQQDPLDIEVGRRVRALRLEKGMSQEKLGNQLALTFQQIQKYENGTNRIGAAKLQRIAQILGVSVSALYPDPVPAGQNSQETEFTRGGRVDRHRLDSTFIARLFAHAQPFLATCADDLGGRNRGEIVMAL
jgi:transcriptional regulator with XRE-family HTH domain